MRRLLLSAALVCALAFASLPASAGNPHSPGDESCPPDETCPQSAEPSPDPVVSVIVDGVLFIFSLV